MNSEHRENEPEPRRQPDGDTEFLCRENPPVDADEGWVFRSILEGLPLRADFTDEVLARIREEGGPVTGDR